MVASIVGVGPGLAGALLRYTAVDYAAGIVGAIGMAVPIFVIGPLFQMIVALRLNWRPVGGLPKVAGGEPARHRAPYPVTNHRNSARKPSQDRARRGNWSVAHSENLCSARGAVAGVCRYWARNDGNHHRLDSDRDGVWDDRHLVDAALIRDDPLVMGIALLYGGLLNLFNMGTNLLPGWLDPRLLHG